MSERIEFTAKHRFARITARKAGRIADMIRGRSVNDALELLQFTPNRGAAFYSKVLRSAVANASMDEDVNVNRLYVSDARADVGPLLNNRLRFRPGPQGRAMPFAKRLSHITVRVREHEEHEEASAMEPAAIEAAPAKSKKKATSRKAASSKAAPEKAASSKAAGKKKKG